jgi:hemerythrin-like metal-binding protein
MDSARFKNYILNNDELDKDHWELFQMLDLLICSIKEHRFNDTSAVMDDFLKCFLEHIGHEYALMVEIDFPYIDWHNTCHEHLVRLSEKMKYDVQIKHYDQHAVSKFEESFLDHLDHMDRQIANYISSHLTSS